MKTIIVLLLLSSNLAIAAPSKKIALTFDDLPGWVPVKEGIAERNLNRIIAVLKREKVPATGFVIGKLATQTPDAKRAIEAWARAGLPLANHTWEHVAYSKMNATEFWAGVEKTEGVLKPLREKYGPWPLAFRFPMLNQGGDDSEKEKAANAYFQNTKTLLAHVSIDNSDWAFAQEFDKWRTKNKGKFLATTEKMYTEHLADCIQYAESASEIVFSKQISQILLLHANTLNARKIAGLIGGLRKRGYEFISLTEALKDPVYQPYLYKIPFQPSGDHFLRQMSQVLNKKIPGKDRSAYAYFEEHWAKQLKQELK